MKPMTLFLLLSSCLWACHDDCPEPPSEMTPVFEKVWNTRIYDAPLENVGSDNAYVYGDWYIVTGDHWSHKDPSLIAYDTRTGKLAWKWTQTGRYQEPGINLVGKDNILILSDVKGILAFDINRQTMIWEHIHSDVGPYLGENGQLPIYGDYVYKIINFNDFYGPETLVRYHLATGKEEKIHTFPVSAELLSPNMSPPALYMHPETRDSMLIMVNQWQRPNLSPEKSPTDLVVYNLSRRNTAWTLEKFTPWGSNGMYPPVVYQNTVMVAGDWSIYGVHLLTKSVSWRTQFDNLPRLGNFTTTQHLLVDNRLYVNPASRDVMCLHPESGEVLWHNTNAASNCSPKMLYNDDMLILGSFGLGSVIILDGRTGDVLHCEKGERTYYTDVLYDRATNMYFVQDFAQAVGFKIHKPK